MTGDENELRDVSARFYAAVNAVLRGDTEPMLALWSPADDVSYCDTRAQIVRGRAAIEAYWHYAAAANAEAATRINATGRIEHIVSVGELAYVIAIEEVRREGDPGVMVARATHVYRREDDGWRLLHRHADAAPRIEVPTD